jgi:arginyl-tRNA synthetase
MVNLLRDGEPLRMSKRAGTVVSMEDLVEAVGVDAGRYALARSSSDSMIDVDLDLLTKRTNDNPVFYVQYAHARTCNVTRLAIEDGRADGRRLRALAARARDRVGAARRARAVPRASSRVRLSCGSRTAVARYLETLAGVYHRWYDACRVRPQGDEQVTDLHRTRLWVNEATRTVLARGLDLLGVSAPERM